MRLSLGKLVRQLTKDTVTKSALGRVGRGSGQLYAHGEAGLHRMAFLLPAELGMNLLFKTSIIDLKLVKHYFAVP